MPQVDAFAWDADNEEKIAGSHRAITPDDVDEVLLRRYASFRNKRGRRGAYQIVGRDSHGRYLTIIVEPHDRRVWRPVTVWESSDGERNKAQKQGV